MRLLSKIVALGLAATVWFAQDAAKAQSDYPNRPVRVVVGFAAGGTVDVIARLLAKKVGDLTGGTFLIENIPAASTINASLNVARSAPDGYTLYLTTSTTFATNPVFHSKMPYTLEDFAPITLVSRIPLTLDTHTKFPAKDVKELIAYAKTKPDGVTIATAGTGSVGDVVNTMTEHMVGIRVTSVPYRGGAPAVNDLMKGIIDLFYNNISTAVPLYEGGMIRPLAITGRERSQLIPNVPTMIELGYKDFVMENVVTLLAPKGTPRPLIDKLNTLFRQAMDDPETKKALLAQGVITEGSTPEGTKDVILADAAFVARMAKDFKIKTID